jgi:hypothetical protein
VLLFDLHFDRHAVTVPTRHVGRIESRERLALDDDVLEDLVDGVADVNVAVRVRRPVVKHEAWPPAARFTNALVKPALVPPLQHQRLALCEITTHRKRRVREVQRFLVISHSSFR